MNISLSQITSTLSVFMGSSTLTTSTTTTAPIAFLWQADQPFRMNARDLHSYYVRSDSGQMIPLDNLVTVTESSGRRSSPITTSFRAVEIERLAGARLQLRARDSRPWKSRQKDDDSGMNFEWTGLTWTRSSRAAKALLIFGLGILVVYLTPLGALRELRAALYHSAGCANGRCWARWAGSRCAAFPTMCIAPDRPGDADWPSRRKTRS